jgi:salicylate hydroxylase
VNHVRIGIIGAGMTGLTAALTLAHAGVEGVAVFEAAQALEEVGAGIAIGGNAVRVLQHLGVDPTRFGHVTPALEFRNWNDAKILSCTEIGRRYIHDIGAPYLTFHRATLQHAFVERIRAMGVAVALGHRLQSIETGDERVPANMQFQNGATVAADVVIAADGIRSVVRAIVAPKSVPRYSGEIAFRGVVPTERVPHYPSPENLSIWCGPKTHAVNYAIDDGALVNLFAVFQPVTLPSWTAQTNRRLGERSEALENFRARGWHRTILDLIGASEGDLHYWALMDLPPLKRWSAGRVVLAGNAAHGPLPHQGMGGGMGIESGYAIAALLAAAGHGAYADAFKTFEALRKPRTTKVQAWSRMAGQAYKLSDSARIRQRNETLWQVRDNIRWIHDYDVISAVQTLQAGTRNQDVAYDLSADERLDAYLRDRLGLAPDKLAPSTRLADMGLDSLRVAELFLEFDIDDPPGRVVVGHDWTLGQLRELLAPPSRFRMDSPAPADHDA